MAYRAYVYQCEKGKPFVGYLARYPENAVNRLHELQGNESPESLEERARITEEKIEVKKPGETKWVSLFSEEGQNIVRNPECPNGEMAKSVIP